MAIDTHAHNIFALHQTTNTHYQAPFHVLALTHTHTHTYNRSKFLREKAFAADQSARQDDIVSLSIAGQECVSVPRVTLTSAPESMLAAMFSGRHKLKEDAEGKVLVDRNPKCVCVCCG